MPGITDDVLLRVLNVACLLLLLGISVCGFRLAQRDLRRARSMEVDTQGDTERKVFQVCTARGRRTFFLSTAIIFALMAAFFVVGLFL